MFFSYGERIVEEGRYIAERGATVRKTAEAFGVSKSCVHKDVTEKLKNIDGSLCEKVKKVLKFNFEQKHLRGGMATKKKYEKEKALRLSGVNAAPESR